MSVDGIHPIWRSGYAYFWGVNGLQTMFGLVKGQSAELLAVASGRRSSRFGYFAASLSSNYPTEQQFNRGGSLWSNDIRPLRLPCQSSS